eukprot:scaffold59966_cov69-Phaeocystis_antarctica.AAC.2
MLVEALAPQQRLLRRPTGPGSGRIARTRSLSPSSRSRFKYIHLVLHGRATARRRALAPTSVDAAALGGAEQGARRSARTMPSPVRSPPAIQQQD